MVFFSGNSIARRKPLESRATTTNYGAWVPVLGIKIFQEGPTP